MSVAALTDYDKLIIKHLNALAWLESLERDYQHNKLTAPREIALCIAFLRFFLGKIGQEKIQQLKEESLHANH